MKSQLVLAIRPVTFEIERALLCHDHFGAGHHAIRFSVDGMNGPYHSERSIPWEPTPAGRSALNGEEGNG